MKAMARKRLKNIKAIFYDFDGVMTDNKVLVLSDGSEGVFCHRGDGWGVSRLKKLGFHQCIVSTETNPVVAKRALKLGIPCIQGIQDKGQALLRYAKDNNINLQSAAYIGNDVNDLPAMKLVGLKVAPQDAASEILSLADIVTSAKGGQGVVYEFFKYLLPGK